MGRIEESCSLVLQSIGSIISEFLQIMHLDSLSKAWSVFVIHIHDTVSFDRRNLSPPALRCLWKVVKALSGAAASLQEKVSESWECVWRACSDMGSMVLQGGEFQLSPRTNTARLHRAFTQESLVALVVLYGIYARLVCPRLGRNGHFSVWVARWKP
jgi:hypothetical protein